MRDDTLAGRRVRLICSTDEYTRLEPGTEGTVQFEDSFGTLHVDWDDGSKLGLIEEDGDRWELLP